jgi:hypothetical protein
MRHGHAARRRLTPIGDQVQVEGPGRIRRVAVAAEAGLDAVQGDQRLLQAEQGFDQYDAVQVGRIGRVRPGRRSPPTGPSHDVEPCLVQRCERRFQQRFGRREIALQVRSERDDDGLIAMLGV